MRCLIHAELLKMRTARTFYGYALAALAFVPASVALAISTAGQPGSAALNSSEGVRHVMASAWSGGSIVLILGIMLVTGEFRHSTVTSTFLVSPDRRRVVAAKLAAAGGVGLTIAAVAAALTLATAVPWLAAKDVHVSIVSADVGVVLLGVMAATALYALVGVGVGALIRNQTAALTVALVWTFLVEALLVSLVPAVGRWLPGGAASALTFTPAVHGGLLPIWGAALVLIGYGLTFAAAGTQLLVRRDIA
jgi:hypothetical protein